MLAFEQVFNTYHSKLFYFILDKTKSEYIAEEVVQLTFIKLWNYRASLNDDYAISTQIFRIASTTLIDILRKQANHQVLIKGLTQISSGNQLDTYDPNVQLIEKELLRKVARTLDEMPEMQRTVFQLSRVDGLSYKQIADKLSISVKTVEVHMTRALKKLRKQVPIVELILYLYILASKG